MARKGQVDDTKERDPEREARRRLALRRIRQYGDPALRLRAGEVDSFDDDLARLVEGMTALMHDAHGVGLAGNQVGVLRRVLVFSDDDDDRAVVNPVIVERSEATKIDDEGCLSLQGVLVPVERAAKVVLEGLDPQGAPVRYELEHTGARVVQHEVDHLDGVLIIDRTTPEKRREALKALRPRPALSLR